MRESFSDTVESMRAPPMHNMIKVPVFAGLLLALWVATWMCSARYAMGLGMFLVLALTVAEIVGALLPLGYGLLVVILFWCSALVLLAWPTGGYPANVGWGTMAVGFIVHLCVQAAVYIGADDPR